MSRFIALGGQVGVGVIVVNVDLCVAVFIVVDRTVFIVVVGWIFVVILLTV